MKILYVHQHFQVPTQAGGTRSYEMARALVARGHAVTMICGATARLGLPSSGRRGMSRGMVDGIDVIQMNLPYSNADGLWKRTWTFLRYAWRGIQVALTEDYDLLFATSTPLTSALPGLAAKLFRRKKFVFEVRDLWPELPRALGMRNPLALGGMSALEWAAYHAADGLIGLSPGICDGIRRRAPKETPVEMVPNGCDVELFTPAKRSMERLPGVGEKDVTAVFTGAHGVANGLDAVLDVAAVLLRRGRPEIKLVFIGDGKRKPDLQARAVAEGLSNCLFFAPMPKVEVCRTVASADIGLMVLKNVKAFYFGTSPNKFFDYIASGLPVVNNYPGWLAGLMGEYDCGVAVPPEDPEAFAEALIRLADSPEERHRLGANARRLAETKFPRARLAEAFCTFLESCAGRSAGA